MQPALLPSIIDYQMNIQKIRIPETMDAAFDEIGTRNTEYSEIQWENSYLIKRKLQMSILAELVRCVTTVLCFVR